VVCFAGAHLYRHQGMHLLIFSLPGLQFASMLVQHCTGTNTVPHYEFVAHLGPYYMGRERGFGMSL
jgi:hypothetical protein